MEPFEIHEGVRLSDSCGLRNAHVHYQCETCHKVFCVLAQGTPALYGVRRLAHGSGYVCLCTV